VLKPVRNLLHRYIPSQFHDPFGLLIRLLRTKDPAAFFAMATAGLGIVVTPLDMLLTVIEKRTYQNATAPKQPLIFVCGAPRTGTTLMGQVLINNLPVCFINNLTSVFPRSPITANRLFGRWMGTRQVTYESFYGKSLYFSGPNDALYIWDRWFGKDRTVIPTTLDAAQKDDMVRFFGAYQQVFQKPLVNKNNNMNTYASLVADALPDAHFICMTRDPLYLAQSLLKARLDIHGDLHVAYGIGNPENGEDGDYIEDVCRQVLFHERAIKQQQEIIGADRFWIVQYEEFCKQPELLVKRVYDEILGQAVDIEAIQANLKPFEVNNKVKLEADLFEDVQQTLIRLKNEIQQPI
jgi:hypothetical protein